MSHEPWWLFWFTHVSLCNWNFSLSNLIDKEFWNINCDGSFSSPHYYNQLGRCHCKILSITGWASCNLPFKLFSAWKMFTFPLWALWITISSINQMLSVIHDKSFELFRAFELCSCNLCQNQAKLQTHMGN